MKRKYPLTDEQLLDCIRGFMFMTCIGAGYTSKQFMEHIAHLIDLYKVQQQTEDILLPLQGKNPIKCTCPPTATIHNPSCIYYAPSPQDIYQELLNK